MLRNKTIKKIIVTILTFILTLSVNLFGCNCYLTGKGLVADDYFIYWISGDGSFAGLIGLTELGRQQEYLIVPQYVDGVIPVEQVGGTTNQLKHVIKEYGEDCAGFNSSVLKRIYVPFYLEEIWVNEEEVGDKARDDFNIMFLGANEYAQHDFTRMKISYKAYADYSDYVGEPDNCKITLRYEDSGRMFSFLPANVAYLYNYEEAPNEGGYWVDDYDGEVISYVPENPVREGYTFDGWYKEPECINKWDFAKDIVPKKIIKNYVSKETGHNYVKYEYKQTSLYAKWSQK